MRKLLGRLSGLRREGRSAFAGSLLLLILIGSGIAGCVSGNSTKLIRNAGAEAAAASLIIIPSEAAKQCTPAVLPQGPHPSKDQLRAFAEGQTTKLEVCDERRALGVEAMVLHNQRVGELVRDLRPRHWWEFWR